MRSWLLSGLAEAGVLGVAFVVGAAVGVALPGDRYGRMVQGLAAGGAVLLVLLTGLGVVRWLRGGRG